MATQVEAPVVNGGQGLQHLEQVLQSECFKRATTLRSLLLYLWNNREKDLSEYAIAVEALGRSHDFESRIDASVRVQISRLRQFLAKYYETEGRDAKARLVVPMGTHQIALIEVPPNSDIQQGRPEAKGTAAQLAEEIAAPAAATIPPPIQPIYRYLVLAMGATIVLLLASIVWLLWGPHRTPEKPAAISQSSLPVFWRHFLDNGKTTRIVLPTPVFFSWGSPDRQSTLLVRDTTVNDFSKADSSTSIAALEKTMGKPHQWQNYTVASDTLASLRLARFLDGFGVQTSFSNASESPHGIMDHENIITFGTAASLADYDVYLAQLSYHMGLHEQFIIDRSLPVERQRVFSVRQESPSRQIVPGIIALLPQGPSGGRILILQGMQTNAMVHYLTSEGGMQEIAQAQDRQGHNQYFEAVVLSEVDDGDPIQSRLVGFRPFAAAPLQTHAVPPTGATR